MNADINKSSSLESSVQFQLTPSPNLNNPNNSNRIISLKDYINMPDRSKSIDNCFLSQTPLSSVRELHFFDEIEKISHNLFKITVPGSTSQHQSSAIEVKKNEEPKYDENNNETWKNHRFAEIFNRLASKNLETDLMSPKVVHWPVSQKRTKYKVNQMSSRDVPILNDRKPKLQKQSAIDSADANFDSDIMQRKFYESDDRKQVSQSHINRQIFIYNSNSIDCGQLNSFRSIFELHASEGQTVKKMQASFESKQN